MRLLVNEAIIDGLAVHRISRLIASDIITQPARDALIRKLYRRRGDQRNTDDWTARALHDGPDAPKLATLIVCRWCSSVHAAVAVVILRRFVPRAWSPVARALAFSSAAGLLGVWEHFVEPQEVEIVDEDA